MDIISGILSTIAEEVNEAKKVNFENKIQYTTFLTVDTSNCNDGIKFECSYWNCIRYTECGNGCRFTYDDVSIVRQLSI